MTAKITILNQFNIRFDNEPENEIKILNLMKISNEERIRLRNYQHNARNR